MKSMAQIIIERYMFTNLGLSVNEDKDKLQIEYEKYGEHWNKTDALDNILKNLKGIKDTKETSNIGIMDVFDVNSDHYIIKLKGGLNGSGNWRNYLKDIQTIIKELKGSYVIDLDVDVPDDVWVVYIGVEKVNK